MIFKRTVEIPNYYERIKIEFDPSNHAEYIAMEYILEQLGISNIDEVGNEQPE